MNAHATLHAIETGAPVLPPAPVSVEETGLGFSFLAELLAKTLYMHGQLRLPELVAQIRLLPGVLTPLLAFLRAEKLLEVTRRGETEAGNVFSLTELGRARAEDFRRRSQYVGAAPVTLAAYTRQVEQQAIGEMGVTQERLRRAFDGIVVKQALLDQFGSAINSGRAIFIYGPAGSGKTYLAERLVGLLHGHIAVPHALTVDGEVIQIFDPLVHQAVHDEPRPALLSELPGLDRGRSGDPRWVLCKRPVVMSGAELTLSTVDLEFDPRTRFYQAPQQVKANNGIFILDDLGRQLVSPQELMNRWIVPLDRRVDFLTLHTGQKFRVPFDVIVVFSSNLKPGELADEAFLRRLGYKIYVGPLEQPEYRLILEQTCRHLRVPFCENGLRYLYERHEKDDRPLLACLPRDIVGQVKDYARFHGHPPQLSPELLDWAWNNYFARE